MGNAAYIVEYDTVASSHRTSVQHQSVNQHLPTAMHMASFVSALRTRHTSSQNAHVVGILHGEGAGEVTATSQIDGGLRLYAHGVLWVEAWCIVDEVAPLLLCLLLRRLHRNGWFRCEDKQVRTDVAIKFHTHVLGLEEQELHGGIVLYVGNHTLVVGAYSHFLVFSVLANHPHKGIASEVEERVGDFGNAVLIVADGWC